MRMGYKHPEGQHGRPAAPAYRSTMLKCWRRAMGRLEGKHAFLAAAASMRASMDFTASRHAWTSAIHMGQSNMHGPAQLRTAVIMLVVSVPVLSEQMTEHMGVDTALRPMVRTTGRPS